MKETNDDDANYCELICTFHQIILKSGYKYLGINTLVTQHMIKLRTIYGSIQGNISQKLKRLSIIEMLNFLPQKLDKEIPNSLFTKLCFKCKFLTRLI